MTARCECLIMQGTGKMVGGRVNFSIPEVSDAVASVENVSIRNTLILFNAHFSFINY